MQFNVFHSFINRRFEKSQNNCNFSPLILVNLIKKGSQKIFQCSRILKIFSVINHLKTINNKVFINFFKQFSSTSHFKKKPKQLPSKSQRTNESSKKSPHLQVNRAIKTQDSLARTETAECGFPTNSPVTEKSTDPS